MRLLWRAWPAAALLALVLPAAAQAAGRQVTIDVRDAQDRPVAGARVLISADEMDAIGTTDAAGKVRVETTSATIEVTVQKDSREATVKTSGASVQVVLAGGAQ